MGRMITKRGKNNKVAAIFFFIYGILVSTLLFMDYYLVQLYKQQTGRLTHISIGIQLTIIGAFMTSNVPIDVSMKAHYSWALFGFVSNIYMSICMLIEIIRNASNEWFLITIISLLLFTALLYIIGFIKRYRYAALFQKLWIVFSSISFYLYIDYFLKRLIII